MNRFCKRTVADNTCHWSAQFFVTLLFMSMIGCQTYRNNPLRADAEPQPVSIPVYDAQRNGVAVSIIAADSLRTGTVALDIELRDAATGERITPDELTVNASLVSDTLFIAPTTAATAVEGKLRSFVFLPRAALWNFSIRFKRHDRIDSVGFVRSVGASWRCAEMSGTDSKRYLLFFSEPQYPQVGVQDFLWFIYQERLTRDGDNLVAQYFPVSDFTVVFETLMPSMGHGSEGNENPRHTQNGAYRGRIGFNMKGDWRIDVWCTRGGSEIGRTFFFFIL